MPYRIVKRSGPRPFKIIRVEDGRTVGSSKTRVEAQASIRARHAGETKKRG